MNEAYENFPIREQDSEVREVLDLMQGWGAPAHEPLYVRLRRGLARVATWLHPNRRGPWCPPSVS
jgi:hypothetical protein